MAAKKLSIEEQLRWLHQRFRVAIMRYGCCWDVLLDSRVVAQRLTVADAIHDAYVWGALRVVFPAHLHGALDMLDDR